MTRGYILAGLLVGAAALVISTTAQERSSGPNASSLAREVTLKSASDSNATHNSALPNNAPKPKNAGATERLEGEERFRTNCGRCHQPPHKFPPRVMATAIRHMRVRAMITDEDMRLILRYMTE